jgi:hypothetical protein
MGNNGKVELTLWNFAVWTQFQEHIPPVILRHGIVVASNLGLCMRITWPHFLNLIITRYPDNDVSENVDCVLFFLTFILHNVLKQEIIFRLIHQKNL